ncbi:hypothetical protein BGZ65_008723, partial [Modicella reniformis]
MVFGNIVSSPRGNLSPKQALELANVYLENAKKATDPVISFVLCHDTELSLNQARKVIKDQTLRDEVGTAYIQLGRVLDDRGRRYEAKSCCKRGEKLRTKVQDQDQFAQSSDPNNTVHPTKRSADSQDSGLPQKQHKKDHGVAVIPAHIFPENVSPPTIVSKLPAPDERLHDTPQLACCLSLLKASHSLDNMLKPDARKWLQTIEKDEDEQERLKVMATDVIRAYKRDELKDAKAVAEVVSLSPALEKDAFRDLLTQFYDGITQSDLLNFHQLDGLAQLIQGADPGYLDTDDLVKILELISTRLRKTHQQSPRHIYQLTATAARVLDAMADTNVTGLD